MLAEEQARRLGHDFLGCEHLLYGLARVDSQASTVLRDRGVTPQRYEQQFVTLTGPHGPTGGERAADPLDGDALATIGIDIDVVRERIESVFGPGALTRTRARPARLHLHRPRRPRPRCGHLPLTRRAKKCLGRALRQEREHRGAYLSAEEIALALLAMNRGLTARILSAMGVSASDLRAEILRRYQPAHQ
jgi:ATP-dependent Clp protease ATP-binding subunit ClpA